MTAQELAEQAARASFGDLLSEPAEFRGEVTLKLSDAERIAEVCAFAKKELGFDYLVDISSVDNYGEDPRFTLVYELYGYGASRTSALEDRCERGKVRSCRRSQASGERPIGTSARSTT